jgi:hypothetical protein
MRKLEAGLKPAFPWDSRGFVTASAFKAPFNVLTYDVQTKGLLLQRPLEIQWHQGRYLAGTSPQLCSTEEQTICLKCVASRFAVLGDE